MFNTSLYQKSPVALQELIISSRAAIRNTIRQGASFRRHLDEALQTERFGEEELRNYQLQKTLAIVDQAFHHVPYYKEMFNRLGLKPDDIKTLEDLSVIPYTSKKDIIAQGHRILANNIRRERIKGSTSGTTGTPVMIYQNLDAINRENAFMYRKLKWAGYELGERSAWLRGDMVVPVWQKEEPFWRLNRADNMLMMSSYHLSQTTGAGFINALREFDPKMIQAYPSSIGYLANYLESAGQYYSGASLNAIVTASETLTPEQRAVVERRFQCRVYDWYGNFERVAAIGTCEHGAYHVNEDYAYTEFIPQEDGTAEIVGTGFNNFLMPLIRYRTNDFVVLADEPHFCPCGRNFRIVKKVEGRKEDCIKTPEGRSVGRLDHIFKGLKNIAEAQIIQDRIDEIRVLLVPFEGFDAREKLKLIENAYERVGREMRINIELVPEIPRTHTGKFRSVICNV